MSGCSFTEKKPGWGTSGYSILCKSKEIKFGSISKDIIYDISLKDPKDRRLEEDIKDEGFILGMFFKKSF